MAIDNRACPICGGPVIQEEFVGHVSTGLQPHHHLYKAFCQSCQIKLERIITGKQDTGWFSSSVDEQNIVGKLSDEDVAQVEKMLAKYPALLANGKNSLFKNKKRIRCVASKSRILHRQGSR